MAEITLLCLLPGCPCTSATAATTHQPQAAPRGPAWPHLPLFPPFPSPLLCRLTVATSRSSSQSGHCRGDPSSLSRHRGRRVWLLPSPSSPSQQSSILSSLLLSSYKTPKQPGLQPQALLLLSLLLKSSASRQNTEPCPTGTWHRPPRPASPGFASPLLHQPPPTPMLVADVPRATAEKPGRRLCRYAVALLGLSQRELKKKKRDFTLKAKKHKKKKK